MKKTAKRKLAMKKPTSKQENGKAIKKVVSRARTKTPRPGSIE
jgi:hypothetical protein